MSGSETIKPAKPTRLALFSAFLKIGLLGFGGVAAWARHVLVVERRILGARDFAESFGLASSLPGANTVNLAAMLGDRYGGLFGALAAVMGLMGAPVLVLLAVAAAYARYGGLADVEAGLFGAAAAAAGVVLATSLKILSDLEPDLVAILAAAAVCFASISKVPMLAILGVAIPLSVAAKLWRKRHS